MARQGEWCRVGNGHLSRLVAEGRQGVQGRDVRRAGRGPRSRGPLGAGRSRRLLRLRDTGEFLDGYWGYFEGHHIDVEEVGTGRPPRRSPSPVTDPERDPVTVRLSGTGPVARPGKGRIPRLSGSDTF